MDPMKTHGMFSWNELMTTDTEKSKEFYSAMFGWTYEETPLDEMGMPGQTYSSAKLGDVQVGGMMAMPPGTPENVPPHWGAYVTVDDVDKSVATCQELGGKLLHGPQDIPGVGRFAVIMDPVGAVLSLMTYA